MDRKVKSTDWRNEARLAKYYAKDLRKWTLRVPLTIGGMCLATLIAEAVLERLTGKISIKAYQNVEYLIAAAIILPTVAVFLTWVAAVFEGVRLSFTLRCFCPHCGMHVDWFKPWMCGFCNTKNSAFLWSHVFHECSYCKKEPDYLLCPHCQVPILLGQDTGETKHAARFQVSDAKPMENPEEIRLRLLRERAQQKEERIHALEMARLDAELAKEIAATKALEPKQKKSAEEDWKDTKAALLEPDIVYERELEIARDECGNDADKFERRKMVLDFWHEKHLT